MSNDQNPGALPDDPAAADWAAADRGRRLDHIWVSPELADRVSALKIRREARGWERPSDHVPVTARVEM